MLIIIRTYSDSVTLWNHVRFFELLLIKISGMNKSQIFGKAVRALNDYLSEKGGYIYNEPSKKLSELDEEYVYLANSVTSFGKYEISTGRIIMKEE